MHKGLAAVALVSLLAGCVQPYNGPPVGQYGSAALATQDQTAGIENADRISRFRRLAAMQGMAAPTINQLMLPPGSVLYMSGSVPVVRVVFDERVFFDFNSDVPLPEASPVFDLIAENMRRDVPDAALTILGHTDAVGSDEYNISLSARRAASVMRALIARGVRPDQLSEVAIGKRQPIAPNDTANGRAKNRRVEFLVSSGIDANLAAVQQRVVPASFFKLEAGGSGAPHGTSVAQVLKIAPSPQPTQTRPDATATLTPYAGLPLQPPAREDIERASAQSVTENAPDAPPQMIAPEEVKPLTLLKPEPIHLLPPGDAQDY